MTQKSSFILTASYVVVASSLLSCIVHCTLEEPTLVGVKRCTVLPDVRLPLYWSKQYSPDQKYHTGPTNISTIIGRRKETNNSTRRTQGQQQQHTSTATFGETASDGTIRTSIADVSSGARVVVVAFLYADLHQCSTLAKDLSELIDEANAEYLAEAMYLDYKDEEKTVEVPTKEQQQKKKTATIMGVAINNMWPHQCDEQDEKCYNDPQHEEEAAIQVELWQGKVIQAAPKIPLLQDTVTEQAWDTLFGAYHTDVIIYLDGRVYKYLPSSLAIAHSKELSTMLVQVSREANTILVNPDKFKATLLDALRYSTKWCEGDPSKDFSVVHDNNNNKQSNSSSAWYYDHHESPYHDIVKGFIFAMIAIFSIIIGSLCMKCCCACCTVCERACCPRYVIRRLEMDEDRLGEFTPLASADEYEMKNSSGYDSYDEYDEDSDRFEYGMENGDDEDYSLPMQRMTNPNKAAEEFFKHQEAAEREMALQEDLSSRNSAEDEDDDDHLMTSLDLEMIERKIVESIGNA